VRNVKKLQRTGNYVVDVQQEDPALSFFASYYYCFSNCATVLNSMVRVAT